MTGHKHAALMLQYAQDAAETDKPWLLWEMKHPSGKFWQPFYPYDDGGMISWRDGTEYRRKPRTIRIGGFEVPEPMREAPRIESIYYSPHLIAPNHFVTSTWSGNAWDRRLLNEGMVYVDEESAVLCARALLSLLEPRK